MSPWVRLDDRFDDDPRVATAGPSAAGLLTMLLAYSNRNLCDGFVSAGTVRQKALGLPDAEAVIALMVKVGLLQPGERDGITGFGIHQDFVKLQPTREQVEADRSAAKTRKERWRERHRNAEGTDGERQRNGAGTEMERRSERQRNGDGTDRERSGIASGTHPPDPDPDPDPDPGSSELETAGVVRKGESAERGEPQSAPPSDAAAVRRRTSRGFTPVRSPAADPDLQRRIAAVATMKPGGVQ